MSALKYALSLLALLVVSTWAEVTTLHVSNIKKNVLTVSFIDCFY
jgi:hypothetical protein